MKNLMKIAALMLVTFYASHVAVAESFSDVDFSGDWTYDWPAKNKKMAWKIEKVNGTWRTSNKSAPKYYWDIRNTDGNDVVFNRRRSYCSGTILDVNTIEFTRSGTKRTLRRVSPIVVPEPAEPPAPAPQLVTIVLKNERPSYVKEHQFKQISIRISGIDKNGDGFLTRLRYSPDRDRYGAVIRAGELIEDEITELIIENAGFRSSPNKLPIVSGAIRVRIPDAESGKATVGNDGEIMVKSTRDLYLKFDFRSATGTFQKWDVEKDGQVKCMLYGDWYRWESYGAMPFTSTQIDASSDLIQ